jgi:hypothetical protein
MNDYMEHRWLLDKAIAQVETLAKEGTSKEASDDLCKAKAYFEYHPYICCFSGAADLLSQWRAYSDNGAGYAIGFSVDGLRKRCEEHTPNRRGEIMLSPVQYDIEEQSKIIDKWVNDYLGKYATETLRQDGGNSFAFSGALLTYKGLWQDATLCKNPGFMEEDEYRLVLRPTLAPTATGSRTMALVGPSNLDFRVGGTRLIPFYTFRFNPDDVVKILIGPANPERDSHYGIELFLRNKEYHIDPGNIINSKVTYRL